MITLITSASYVNTEMAAEFGRLPPALLPLGTRRLIDHQIDALRSTSERILLSLPEGFVLPDHDLEAFARREVNLIYVQEGLTLGHSVLNCIRQAELHGPMAILHGDTLIEPPESAEANVHLIASGHGGYEWGQALLDGDRFVGARGQNEVRAEKEDVLVGYFRFSEAGAFADALEAEDGRFLDALTRHAEHADVRALPCRDWSDFGHLQTYYRSRAAFASSRSFNNLQIGQGMVRKRSRDTGKIQAEARWFSGLPPTIQPFTARLLDSGPTDEGGWQYATEYEHLPTLQELSVYGRLDRSKWGEILEACCSCLEVFAGTHFDNVPQDVLMRLCEDKTRARMDRYERESGLCLDRPTSLNGQALPSPRQIADEMIDVVRAAGGAPAGIMHGDFCYSNILYNSRTGRVRLIDPRGEIDGLGITVAGDHRYDMAKLAHSVIGYYDLIIAGQATCSLNASATSAFTLSFPEFENRRWIARELDARTVAGTPFSADVIRAATVLLFLSMLPLHADRPARQTAFIANALRLYGSYFAETR